MIPGRPSSSSPRLHEGPQTVYRLYMDKDALKKLKKQYEQKSKEVLKDIDALAKHESKGDLVSAEFARRRIRKGAVDATTLLRQVGTLLPPPTPKSRG